MFSQVYNNYFIGLFREEMLTLMKGSLFVQMEEDGIEERDDSIKDLVSLSSFVSPFLLSSSSS